MKNIVPFIIGPTGVGKTRLSLLLAEKIDLEIISADSRQLYRFMDIGTAKVEKAARRKIPHHFVDICNPDEYYSAGRFSQEARRVVKSIRNRDKLPLVVGGSGLYIKALIDGFFDGNIKDLGIRDELNRECEKSGLKVLYRRLTKCDSDYAKRINPNDKQRILRSLEVFLITGVPFSRWIEKENRPAAFEAQLFGLQMERKALYERINARVEKMLSEGLIEEAEQLLKKGYSKELNSLNTVGYKEVFQYLNKELTFEEMAELIKRNSRRYAKRQMTWFRKDERIHWFPIRTENDLILLRNKILDIILH